MGKTTDIKKGPDLLRDTVAQLTRNTMLRVVGKTGRWYKVWLPDGRIGYADAKNLSTTLSSLKTLTIEQERPLWALPSLDSYAVERLPAKSSVKILGVWQNFFYAEEPNGKRGWLNTNSNSLETIAEGKSQ